MNPALGSTSARKAGLQHEAAEGFLLRTEGSCVGSGALRSPSAPCPAAGISWLGVQPAPWSPCPLREGRVWRGRGMAAGPSGEASGREGRGQPVARRGGAEAQAAVRGRGRRAFPRGAGRGGKPACAPHGPPRLRSLLVRPAADSQRPAAATGVSPGRAGAPQSCWPGRGWRRPARPFPPREAERAGQWPGSRPCWVQGASL